MLRWLALSPDGARLATTDFQNTVLLWDMRDATIIERIPGIYSDQLMFSPDNRHLLCNGAFATPPMDWDIATGHAVTAPKAVSGYGHFTADGHYWEYRTPYGFHYVRTSLPATQGMPLEYLYLDTGEKDNLLTVPATLNLRDLESGNIERAVPGITGQLLDISRDNRKAVTVTGAPRMRGNTMLGIDNAEFIVWDLSSGKEITRLNGLHGFIIERNAARFSPDGSKFAAASSTYDAPPELRIWDTNTGALLQTLNTPAAGEHGEAPLPHTNCLDVLAFSADGAQLASGGLDGHAVVWDIAGGHMRNIFRTAEGAVKELTFTPDGTQLLTASESPWRPSSIQLWDVPADKLRRTYAGILRPATMLASPPRAVTPDGKLLAIGAGDHIDLWDLRAGCVRRQLPLPEKSWPPFSMAINPDGTLLLATLAEKNGLVFTVWDLTTGAVKKTMPTHSYNYDCLVFSPDGAYAVGCNESSLILWATKDWSEVKQFDNNPGMLNETAFNPDGTKLAWISTSYTNANVREPTGYLGYRRRSARYALQRARSCLRRSRLQCGWKMAGNAHRRASDSLECHRGQRRETCTVARGSARATSYTPALSFTADDRQLLCIEHQHLLCCDIDTGETKPTTLGALSPFLGISLLRHGRELITWDVDGTASLWDSAEVIAQHTAQPRATLHTFANNLWLITTPPGYFDCAPGVTQGIRWQQGAQSYPCAKFEKQYHQPELVRKALEMGG